MMIESFKILLLLTVICSVSDLYAKTLEQMQDLYKNIGTDLMSIRRDFSAAQPKIYAILDRIDKMYNLAKVTAEKKQHLKLLAKNQGSEIKKLNEEINSLKSKVAIHEEELNKTHQKLEATKSELQKEKANSNKPSQEKAESSNDSSSEQDDSQSKLHKLKTDDYKKQPEPKELAETKDLMRTINGLSDEEKAILGQTQSLSLSSTSAPSSPR
jgi:chromosome segregation ATPase